METPFWKMVEVDDVVDREEREALVLREVEGLVALREAWELVELEVDILVVDVWFFLGL